MSHMLQVPHMPHLPHLLQMTHMPHVSHVPHTPHHTATDTVWFCDIGGTSEKFSFCQWDKKLQVFFTDIKWCVPMSYWSLTRRFNVPSRRYWCHRWDFWKIFILSMRQKVTSFFTDIKWCVPMSYWSLTRRFSVPSRRYWCHRWDFWKIFILSMRQKSYKFSSQTSNDACQCRIGV